MNRIVNTEVSEKILKTLDAAIRSGEMVAFIGGSRTGKSHTAAYWAGEHPGVGRLISLPCSNQFRDLLLAFAQAYEIRCDAFSPIRSLDGNVRHAIAAKQIYPIVDEAHGFWSSIHCCDWWRHTLVDARVPHAIILTPRMAVEGSIVHEVIDRAYHVCRLPAKLSPADLAKLGSKNN